jgi:hypothetical protein
MAFPEVIGHPGARNTCLYVVMTPEDSMFTRAKPIEATMVRNALHTTRMQNRATTPTTLYARRQAKGWNSHSIPDSSRHIADIIIFQKNT